MILGHQHIREAKLGDFDQVAHLIADAHRAAGDVSDHYQARAVKTRLQAAWVNAGQILVMETDGVIVATGALVEAGFARNAYALCLGATHPDHQGKRLGHALVERRLQLAAQLGAGLVLVSSRNTKRWSRYRFVEMTRNPVTGAALMGLQLDWRS